MYARHDVGMTIAGDPFADAMLASSRSMEALQKSIVGPKFADAMLASSRSMEALQKSMFPPSYAEPDSDMNGVRFADVQDDESWSVSLVDLWLLVFLVFSLVSIVVL